MDESYTFLFECYRELRAERKLITAQAVKARYFGEDDDNRSIKDIINYHNEDMEGKLKWGTQKNYFTTQRYIFKFLQKSYGTTDKYIGTRL